MLQTAVSIDDVSPFFSQAQRVCGEGGHAGRPEAAVRAGLHTHGQSVEAGLRGTVVVYGIREKVSSSSPPTICLHLSPSRVKKNSGSLRRHSPFHLRGDGVLCRLEQAKH